MPDLRSEFDLRASRSRFNRTAFRKILQREVAVCRALLLALTVCILGSAIGSSAQEERPQIYPGERKPKAKKDIGPRAVAVLQIPANGKATLVPIAILINGKFWDATVYKADPVPMALDYGTVYEGEHSGNSLGLFTVGAALHRNSSSVGDLAAWIGTGSWRPIGAEPEKKPARAEATPVGIDLSEGPPRLTRDTAAKPSDSTASAANKGSSTNAPASAPPKSTSGSGDEPPRLSKPTTPSDSGPGQPGDSSAKPAAESKPADAKATEAKKDQAKIPASDSGTAEGNRPRLRRGKPTESFADEDVPGYSKIGERASTQGDLSKAGPIARQGDVQLVPAISDASGPELRSYVFQWLKGEEEDRQKQITDFAKEQLRAYIAQRAKAMVTTTTTRSSTKVTPKVPDPVLENVRVVAYDLWVSNQPVMVLSAEGHLPPPAPGAAHSEVESGMQYSVLIVAFPDIYNNLHQLYVGITDKFHLDVTPRLELVDAVDADGDGRGELLFREISDQGSGWVIYRATADKLWKMYDSFRPE